MKRIFEIVVLKVVKLILFLWLGIIVYMYGFGDINLKVCVEEYIYK